MILPQYLTVTVENMIIPLTTLDSLSLHLPLSSRTHVIAAGHQPVLHGLQTAWPRCGFHTPEDFTTGTVLDAKHRDWCQTSWAKVARHSFFSWNIEKNTRSGIDYVEQEVVYSSKFKARSRSGWLPTGQEQVVLHGSKFKAPFKQWLITSIKYNYRHQI